MLKLYFHTTPNSFKVAFMLEELGIPYETIPVDTRKGDQHTPEFLKINPNAKLPAMEVDGTVIFDSGAMVLWLAQKYDRFLPKDEAALGEMLSWYFFVSSGIGPYSGQAVHFTRIHQDSSYATNRYSKEIARHYKVLDERLAASKWLGGEEFTIADITAWGWVRAAGFVLNDELGLKNYPHVQAWFDIVEQRPAAGRAKTLATKHDFKAEVDEEAKRAMFPQNY